MNDKPRKRVKWEPAFLMILLLFLGFWLALGPTPFQKLPLRDGATKQQLQIADTKGVIETLKDSAGVPTFRIITRDGHASPILSADQVQSILGPTIFEQTTSERPNWIFRLLNITTWASLVWIVLGFLGQGIFASRFLVQWLISEKQGKAVVPESFWWLSLIGGVACFAYFVWRQDPVAILGQSSGVVIYARNLRLIYKRRRREAAAAASA